MVLQMIDFPCHLPGSPLTQPFLTSHWYRNTDFTSWRFTVDWISYDILKIPEICQHISHVHHMFWGYRLQTRLFFGINKHQPPRSSALVHRQWLLPTSDVFCFSVRPRRDLRISLGIVQGLARLIARGSLSWPSRVEGGLVLYHLEARKIRPHLLWRLFGATLGCDLKHHPQSKAHCRELTATCNIRDRFLK